MQTIVHTGIHHKTITHVNKAMLCADAINCGLDFEEAMRSSDYVKLSSSPQVTLHTRHMHTFTLACPLSLSHVLCVCLQRICGISLRDHVPKVDTLNRCNTLSVESHCEAKGSGG